MVKKDAIYEEEFNCPETDLVGGVPPMVYGTVNTPIPEGSLVFVWDETVTPKVVVAVFKLVNGAWGILG